MLSWALTFFVVAIIAGIIGLSGVAGAATQIAYVLFVVFLFVAIVNLVMGRRPPVAKRWRAAGDLALSLLSSPA